MHASRSSVGEVDRVPAAVPVPATPTPKSPQHEVAQIPPIPEGTDEWEVLAVDDPEIDLYMVLDTACQKMCHGPRYAAAYHNELRKAGLGFFTRDSYEPFRFGISRAVSRTTEVWPAMLGTVPLILISQLVLENPVLPLLGSLIAFSQLGMILDTVARQVHFTAINLYAVPLRKAANGHLCVRIDMWKHHPFPHDCSAWQIPDIPRFDAILPPQPYWIKTQDIPRACANLVSYAEARPMAPALAEHDVRLVPLDGSPDQSREGAGQSACSVSGLDDRSSVGGQVRGGDGVCSATEDHIRRHPHRGGGTTPVVRGKGPHAQLVRAQESTDEPTVDEAIYGSEEALDALPPLRAPLGGSGWPVGSQRPRPPQQHLSKVAGLLFIIGGCLLDPRPEHGQVVESLARAAGTFAQGPSDRQRFPRRGSGPSAGTRGGGVGIRGAGQQQQHVGGRPPLKQTGPRRRLLHELDRVTKAIGDELTVYEATSRQAAALRKAGPSRSDVIFIGDAGCGSRSGIVSDLASEYGLTLILPPERKQQWYELIRASKPLVVVMSLPASLWSRLNVNCNYSRFPDLLDRLRLGDRETLDAITWTMREQHSSGRYFLFQHPAGSHIFGEDCMDAVYSLPPNDAVGSKVASVIGHSCAYNYRVDGRLILKKFRWLGNHSRLLEAVSQTCDKRHDHYNPRRDTGVRAGTGSGSRTGVSSDDDPVTGYTEELVRAILAATVDLAAYREPSRFAESETQVYYQDADKDITKWQYVIDTAVTHAETARNKAPYTLNEGTAMYQAVAQLVPWRFARIQIVPQPRARRIPIDFPWTHRGALIIPEEGQPYVETEALLGRSESITYPCLRFRQRIKVAVMFWGDAPEDLLTPPGGTEPEATSGPVEAEPEAEARQAPDAVPAPVSE